MMHILDKNERNIIFMARHLATESVVKRGKHCSVGLDKNNRIINLFVNTKDLHAEKGLVQKTVAKKIHKVIVVRARRCDNKLTNSKPCQDCENAMREAGVKYCVYSIDDDTFGELNL